MRLLLDSHAFLWFCEGSSNLSIPARLAIEDAANEKWVSHGTAWELAIKLSIGKLKIAGAYSDLFPKSVDANGFSVLQSRFQHYEQLLKLPPHHGDPFDRLIISQALVEGLTIVTCDEYFPKYGVPTIW
jgi:PIN domain nuclease of toxin-antitoxin system